MIQRRDDIAQAGSRGRAIVAAACCLVLALVVTSGRVGATEAASEFPALSGLRSQAGTDVAHTVPPRETKQDIIRQAPSISGRFQVRDQTLLPFVGAGFGAGYASERDRALGSDLSSQSSGILGSGLSKGLMPNEFQMGIKIPF